jgi:electron transfer flavoprotein beta subunit
MKILVCVKRVPTVGGAITLTADRRAIDTKASGFTISPHEECAVEEAVRLVERFGGSATVATLGPAAAEEQLRSCLALGASGAVLIETEPGVEVGPIATAAALHSVAVGGAEVGGVAAGGGFDLVLLGNEASDTGDYQVGIRLAHLLGWPAATGIKALSVDEAGVSVSASRTYRGVVETFALELPCVVTVKEGINLPRYPSLPGRLRAKRAAITRVAGPADASDGVDASGGAAASGEAGQPGQDVRMTSLRVPDAPKKQATVLGRGAEAVPALVNVLVELGVVS